MARIGRPRIGDEPQVTRSVSMDKKTWDRVDDAAKEKQVTRSAVIRDAVNEHLDK